ncbi:DUF5977 domain-containing protein [Pedobacter sp. NJ-S-72]
MAPTRLSGLPQASKLNTSAEPEFIAPFQNLDKCPINPAYKYEKTAGFVKNDCLSGQGSSVVFSKSYFSNVSDTDAKLKGDQDQVNFDALGQLNANENGVCDTQTLLKASLKIINTIDETNTTLSKSISINNVDKSEPILFGEENNEIIFKMNKDDVNVKLYLKKPLSFHFGGWLGLLVI